MPADDRNDLPVPAPGASGPMPLGREAIERVLARAAELNVGGLDASDGMTEAQLVSLGAEVGITASHMRQALAEERTRVEAPPATGMTGALFGGTMVQASRIVPGTPAALLARLDQWMQREELLRPKRRFADRITWEARRDFLGSLQAGFNLSGRAYALNRATEVGATVMAVDASRSLVSLDADLTDARRQAVIASGATMGVGVAGGAVLAALVVIPGGLPWIAALVGGGWLAGAGGAAYGVGRGQRKRLHRAQLGLEQILDRLEHGEPPRGGPLAELIGAITR